MTSNKDSAARERKYTMMTQAAVRPLVLKMAIPTTISMMVIAFYNLVDSFFVGHLSTEATAGVGITLTYMTVVQALGFYFGHGSGNYISRLLGSQKWHDAEKIAATGFFSAFMLGVLIGVTGLIFIRPLVTMLGATPDIELQTIEYIRYILIATPFMMSSIVMNNQLRHQGNAAFSMIGLASGSILNILLDYLLIIKLEMGISGASMATCISQICSWLLLLGGTMRAGSVHIRPSLFSPTLQNYHQIMRGGLPSIFRQGFSALSTLFLNYAAAHYAMPGQEASTIAAFTIVSRVMLFVYSMILGFGQGFQPVCGFNYGAGNYRRVRLAYGFTLSGSFLLLCCSSTLLILFAPQVIALFRSEDAALIAIGARVMRWQSVIMPTAALVTITNMLYQNIGRTVPATILASLRQGMFFIPILFISPLFFGIDGVITAQAVADLLAFLFAIPFTVKILRELKETPHKA